MSRRIWRRMLVYDRSLLLIGLKPQRRRRAYDDTQQVSNVTARLRPLKSVEKLFAVTRGVEGGSRLTLEANWGQWGIIETHFEFCCSPEQRIELCG